MPLMQIPSWLSKRPIFHEDIIELRQLIIEGEEFQFGNITIDAIKKFYQQHASGDFYKLIRILGFYGVKFFGKLFPYSGPDKNFPDVLCFSIDCWDHKVTSYVTDSNISSLFHTCGIQYLKQLHGVPVKSFVNFSEHTISGENKFTSLPFTIISVHDDFFIYDPLPEKNNDQNGLFSISVDTLDLSVRSYNCLIKARINTIGDLIQKAENELLSIPHLGRYSLNELKEIVKSYGFRLSMTFTLEQVEKIRTYNKVIGDTLSAKWLKKIARELITHPLGFLNERQKMVVKERIWKVGNKRTLEDISIDMNVTRERVRQLEQAALKKIKKQFSRELRETTKNIRHQVEKLGGIANLNELDVDLSGINPNEQIIVNSLVGLVDSKIYIDWDFSLLSLKSNGYIFSICKEIQDLIQKNCSQSRIFSLKELAQVSHSSLHNLEFCPFFMRNILI